MPKVVTSGARLKCSCGSQPGTLKVSGNTAKSDGMIIATTEDYVANKNVKPFGLCSLKGNDACSPDLPSPWKCRNSANFDGNQLLSDDASLKCEVGGQINIDKAGQESAKIT